MKIKQKKMKSIILTLATIFFSVCLFGQNLKIQQAESYFNTYRFAEATPIYKELVQKNNLDVDKYDTLYRHALVSAEKSKDFDFKFDVLEKLSFSSKYTFDDAFEFFQTSLFLGRYQRAKEILSSEIVKNSSSPSKALLDKYDNGSIWDELTKDTSMYSISFLSLNSEKADFNPIIHPDGIVFTSARERAIRKSTYDNTSYLNLYMLAKNDSIVKEVKFLETNRHDGTAYYDSVNQVWYYSKNFDYEKGAKLTKAGIFIYDEKTKIELPFEYNSNEYFTAQPYLSQDGKTLWFASDMAGGYGKADIWFSLNENGNWSVPTNAGELVNTPENEMFPFFQDDVIYFSSKGHAGLGGLDIFSVDFQNQKATNLKNMGANLNSNVDDFAFILDSTRKAGYFSSNRLNYVDNIYAVTIHQLDFVFVGELVADVNADITKVPVIVRKNGEVIDTLYAASNGKFEFKGDKNSDYVFEINNEEFAPIAENYSTVGKTKSDTTHKTFDLSSKYVDVATTVFDEITKKPLANTEVEFVNKATGEITKARTDENGQIQTKLLRNQDYEIKSTHDGYHNNVTALSTRTREKEMKADVSMKVIELAKYLEIDNNSMTFDFDKWNLSNSFKKELDKIAEYLKENPNVKIELNSHTDSRGSQTYNLILSERRTKSCLKYLVAIGVDSDRLIGKWFGETQLINNCKDEVPCSNEQHKENRRTEFVVIY